MRRENSESIKFLIDIFHRIFQCKHHIIFLEARDQEQILFYDKIKNCSNGM